MLPQKATERRRLPMRADPRGERGRRDELRRARPARRAQPSAHGPRRASAGDHEPVGQQECPGTIGERGQARHAVVAVVVDQRSGVAARRASGSSRASESGSLAAVASIQVGRPPGNATTPLFTLPGSSGARAKPRRATVVVDAEFPRHGQRHRLVLRPAGRRRRPCRRRRPRGCRAASARAAEQGRQRRRLRSPGRPEPGWCSPACAAIDGRSSPITSAWSNRTLVITPIVARTMSRSVTDCRTGSSAMHSTTTARAPCRRANRRNASCSRTFAGARRRTGSSRPSGSRTRAAVPVVFATAGIPASRSADQMSRVTVDFPRVPLTWMRMGIVAPGAIAGQAFGGAEGQQDDETESRAASAGHVETGCATAKRPASGSIMESTVHATIVRSPCVRQPAAGCRCLSACSRAETRRRVRRAPRSRPPAAATAPAPRARVVVLGDSLTAGLGLDRSEAYPAILQQRMDAAGYPFEVVNAGVSGDTTAGGLSRLDWSLDGDVADPDRGAGRQRRPPGPAARRDEEEPRRRSSGGRRRAGSPCCSRAWRARPTWAPTTSAASTTCSRRWRANSACAFLPFLLEGVAGRPELNQRDGIHPTAEGARLIADHLWPLLEPMLRAATR